MKNIIWSDDRNLLKMVVNTNDNNICINIMGDNGVSSMSLDEGGVKSLIKYLNLYLDSKNRNVTPKEDVEKNCSGVCFKAMEEINARNECVSVKYDLNKLIDSITKEEERVLASTPNSFLCYIDKESGEFKID